MKTLINAFIAVSSFALMSCFDESDTLESSFQGQNNESISLAGSLYEAPASLEMIDNCGTVVKKLIAKDAFAGGTLFATNDSEELHLVFLAAEGWKVSETHLYFGELGLIPSKSRGKATVSLGQFPYKEHYDPPLVEAPIISFALNELPFDNDGNLIIVAHATVISGEEDLISRSVYAEWVDRLWFSGPQWGGGFIYSKQICDELMLSAQVAEENEFDGVDPLLFEGLCIEPALLNLTSDNEDFFGTVDFSFDLPNEHLVVTYTLPEESEYVISSAHLNFGELDATQVSAGKGRKANPIVGKFDYVYNLQEGVDDQLVFPYTVLLEELNPDFVDGGCELVIVHATLSKEVVIDGTVVVMTKSVFAQWDISFASPKKGGYLELCISNCTDL